MSRTDKDTPNWVLRAKGALSGRGTFHESELIGRWIGPRSFLQRVNEDYGRGRYVDYCTCNRLAEFTEVAGNWVLNPSVPAKDRLYAPCTPLWDYPGLTYGAYGRGRRMQPVYDRAYTRNYLHDSLNTARRGYVDDVEDFIEPMPDCSRRCVCCG